MVAIILALCVLMLYIGIVANILFTPDVSIGSDEHATDVIKELTLAIIGGLIAYLGYHVARNNGKDDEDS